MSMPLPHPPPEGWECEIVEEGDGLAIAMGDEMYAHVETMATAAAMTVEEFLSAAISRSFGETEATDAEPVQ